MAIGSTTSDTMPTPCDGKNLWNGKRKPVTLVSTVVTRNSAVQPSSRFPLRSPNTTTNPDKIPIKLSTTCTKVNVVIPKIMSFPSRWKSLDDRAEREDTTHFLPAQFSSAQVKIPGRKHIIATGVHAVKTFGS